MTNAFLVTSTLQLPIVATDVGGKPKSGAERRDGISDESKGPRGVSGSHASPDGGQLLPELGDGYVGGAAPGIAFAEGI